MSITLTAESKNTFSLSNENKNLPADLWDSGVWDSGALWDIGGGLALTMESKNTLAISNESKPTGGAWGDFPGRTFGDGGTFGQPGTFLTRESKNTLSMSNESKN